MLIEAPYKENDVVSLKLTSGEEIIGRLVEENDNKIILSKPLSLTATQTGIGLAPFMFTIEQESKLKINQTSVITVTKTQKETASQYLENTTGITV